MKAEIIGALVTIGILACGYLFTLFGDCARDSSEFPDQHDEQIAPHSSEIQE